MPKIYEYRGVEGLVYAQVLEDTKDSFTTGTVKELAGVAEISKSTDSTNEAHFYDNLPAVVVSSTGSDEITINASAIPLDVLAEITGQLYDSSTGTYIEKDRDPVYFAIGYTTQDTDGNDYYVWRLKGTFNIPDQDNKTKDDGTDANGQEITYTGISTTHKFVKAEGKAAKAVTVNTGLDLADVTGFFETVQTPDTITPKSTTPSVSLDQTTLSVEVGKTATLVATTVPAGSAVTWASSATDYATVANGVVSGVAEGASTITATITVDNVEYTAECAVTVTPAQA